MVVALTLLGNAVLENCDPLALTVFPCTLPQCPPGLPGGGFVDVSIAPGSIALHMIACDFL